MTNLKFTVTHDTTQEGFCYETNFEVGVHTKTDYIPILRAERRSPYTWKLSYIHPSKTTTYGTLRRKYKSDAVGCCLFYATRAWDHINADNHT